jgi:hypothetical protein
VRRDIRTAPRPTVNASANTNENTNTNTNKNTSTSGNHDRRSTMTKTRKYEGQDLGELLERVRTEHGADARIVGANRCRSGGIAGFFAVESFEVIVEVTDAESKAGAKRRTRRVERNVPADPASGDDVAATGAASIGRRGPRARVRPDAVAVPASSRDADPSPALAALVAAADAAERDASRPGRRPAAASSDDFSAVLDRATAPIAHDGRFDRWLGDGASAQAPSVDRSGDRPPRRILGRRTRIDRKRSSTRPVRPAGSDDRVVDIAALERSGLVPSLAPMPLEPAPRRLAPVRRGDEVSAAALADLGVPSRWLSQDVDGHASLGAVLGNVTPAPAMITSAGTTIAVVGELSLVVDVARAISVALRQDPSTCVLLTTASRPDGFRGEVVTVIDELADRREQWARRSTATVVAVDIGFACHDIAWGRVALSSLRPTMRWGAVSATRKAEDVCAWARGVGGLHALAVTGMSETTTPAAIFDAGVPVGRVDGKVATPELWLRLLNDRIADAMRTPDLVAN